MSQYDSSSDTDYPESNWPEVSGIGLARKDNLTGKGIKIAILDTGIDADHDEFHERTVWFRYVPHRPTDRHMLTSVRGFDTQGHGTHVAGIICGRTLGIAPDAELFVGCVCESDSQSNGLMRFERGLKWVTSLFQDRHPSILNLSLGYFPPPTHEFPEENWNTWLDLIRTTISQLESLNVLA